MTSWFWIWKLHCCNNATLACSQSLKSTFFRQSDASFDLLSIFCMLSVKVLVHPGHLEVDQVEIRVTGLVLHDREDISPLIWTTNEASTCFTSSVCGFTAVDMVAHHLHCKHGPMWNTSNFTRSSEIIEYQCYGSFNWINNSCILFVSYLGVKSVSRTDFVIVPQPHWLVCVF